VADVTPVYEEDDEAAYDEEEVDAGMSEAPEFERASRGHVAERNLTDVVENDQERRGPAKRVESLEALAARPRRLVLIG